MHRRREHQASCLGDMFMSWCYERSRPGVASCIGDVSTRLHVLVTCVTNVDVDSRPGLVMHRRRQHQASCLGVTDVDVVSWPGLTSCSDTSAPGFSLGLVSRHSCSCYERSRPGLTSFVRHVSTMSWCYETGLVSRHASET